MYGIKHKIQPITLLLLLSVKELKLLKLYPNLNNILIVKNVHGILW